MKKKFFLPSLTFIAIILYASSSLAESKWLSLEGGEDISGKISTGAKMHFDYGNFDRIPLKEDDFSYLLFYEIHNDFAFWQIGASFIPDPGNNRFDRIITPQLNLIVKDSIYRLGIGAMTSNISINDKSDWSRFYWQVIFGLGIPVGGSFGIDIFGHYIFESWNNPAEPATDAPEVSLMLNFSF